MVVAAVAAAAAVPPHRADFRQLLVLHPNKKYLPLPLPLPGSPLLCTSNQNLLLL